MLASATDCHAFNLCCLNAVSSSCQLSALLLLVRVSTLGGLLDFAFFPTSASSRATESEAFISTVCDIVASCDTVGARWRLLSSRGTASWGFQIASDVGWYEQMQRCFKTMVDVSDSAYFLVLRR